MGMEVTKQDLAKFMGVALSTVTQWVAKGCPYVTRGSKSGPWVFDTADVVAWRGEQIALQAIGDTASLDIDEARRRKVAAEAATIELGLAKLKGEVVEVDQVAGLVGEDYANVRAKLLALPMKLAPLAVGVTDVAEIQDLVEAGVNEALEELTADGIYSAQSSGESTAAPEDCEPKAAA